MTAPRSPNPPPLTAREVEIVRHALGLTRKPVSWRNHFVAQVGSPDYEILKAMVDEGRADSQAPRRGHEMVVFWIRRRVAEQALQRGERLGPDFRDGDPSEPA